MKEIGKFIPKNDVISSQVEAIKKQVLSNKLLLKYCEAHKITLTEDKVDASLMNLVQFVENHDKCRGCLGLHECKQVYQGFYPILIDQETYINLQYSPCDYQKVHEAKQEVARNLRSFYIPKKILSASFETIEVSDKRGEAIKRAATFAKTYQPGKFQKGIYLSGPFGVGKTYILAAMANELAKRHIPVALVYLPDMIRELKSAIGENNLENLISEIKNVEVLILDDIGSEMNTPWVRDEVLGPILQYRMLEEKPTFFTSNKTISELIRDYAYTNDGVHDETKAKRIGDRIKALSEEVLVSGKNYRY